MDKKDEKRKRLHLQKLKAGIHKAERELEIIKKEEHLLETEKTIKFNPNIHSLKKINEAKKEFRNLNKELSSLSLIVNNNPEPSSVKKPTLKIISNTPVLKEDIKEDLEDLSILESIEDIVIEFENVLEYSKDVLNKEQLLLTYQKFYNKIKKTLD